jgi:hypothetical protein
VGHTAAAERVIRASIFDPRFFFIQKYMMCGAIGNGVQE